MTSITFSIKKVFDNCYEEAKIVFDTENVCCEVYTVINNRVVKNIRKFITEIELNGYSNADLHTLDDSLYLEYINNTLNVYTTNATTKLYLTDIETKKLIESFRFIIDSHKHYKSIAKV